jgi:hypothetical protein
VGTATEYDAELDAAREAEEQGGTFDDGPQDVFEGVELFEDTDGQFVLRVGGTAPTTNAVRLYGGAIEIEPPEEGFQKGRSYVLRVECVCHKVGITDERDSKTGDVVGCRDERGLKITGCAVMS